MIARLGYRWEAGGVLAMIDGAPLLFTTQRRGNKERFGSSELEAMEALFPHFTRAAQISIRLALARAEGVLFAFDQMACGGILLGHNGRVLKVNACAEQLMGKGIDIAGGRIVASNSAGNAALQGIIQAALASEVGLKRERTRPTVVIERYESGPLIAYAIPLKGGIRDVFNPGKAVLVLEEPEARRQVAGTALAETFGLTPAEVRVAVALAEGKDLAAIAEEHRVSIGTIRSQLKSLMAKTDTHRQAELVTLVLLYTVNQVR
jgi:DNA-binding HTH domain-containing proteins